MDNSYCVIIYGLRKMTNKTWFGRFWEHCENGIKISFNLLFLRLKPKITAEQMHVFKSFLFFQVFNAQEVEQLKYISLYDRSGVPELFLSNSK